MSKLNLLRTICLVFVFCAAPMIGSANTFTTLVSFNGIDGEYPSGTLSEGLNGNFYGTTADGGADTAACGGTGCGNIFEITATGRLTTLHVFDVTDGSTPVAGLVLATNGNFYGTTADGGAHLGGTVFEISAGGKLTTLHSFCVQSGCPDGANPGGLIQANNGNFYGMSFGGGADGIGTVFEITTGSMLTTLHSFDGTDGAFPLARLVQATNGNFYDTTGMGGADGVGTVFEITTGGKLTTLHSFDGTDGDGPQGGLVQATDGNLYGTTSFGGAHGDGTVFEISAGGKLTMLYSFCSQPDCTDGETPVAGLIQATNGNFYGTTASGGAHGDGTVFEISAGGKLTTLHSFCSQPGCTDGKTPVAGLIQATNGNFYGTTSAGGTGSSGTVFSLAVGLGPFVETLPTSGKVGLPVYILGNSLTGATSVTFNGTPAKFKIVSSTEITTTIPSGATTGPVKVTTPSGTLISNVSFQVS